jgi:hypothetical protein
VVKNLKTQHRVFTRVEKAIIEERYKHDQLNDKKDREDVDDLISGKPDPSLGLGLIYFA